VSGNDATHREGLTAVSLIFPEFSRFLPCSLIAPRVLANVKQHDVHDACIRFFPFDEYSLSSHESGRLCSSHAIGDESRVNCRDRDRDPSPRKFLSGRSHVDIYVSTAASFSRSSRWTISGSDKVSEIGTRAISTRALSIGVPVVRHSAARRHFLSYFFRTSLSLSPVFG